MALILALSAVAGGIALIYEAASSRSEPSKTHYSVCVENTYPKCVLANKALPSLETYCKIYTELQCKELKL